MNLVGELITDRNRLYQVRSDLEVRHQGSEHVDQLAQVALHLGRITDQLQEEVMRIRMLPIASVFHKYPRLVRDLCRKAGKEVDLVIRGEDTELDRTVIEEISDPLLHLLRNSVDHGIETPDERRQAGKSPRGQITLTARHEESRIILTVEDDGHGIDLAAVKASALRKGLISEMEAAALTEDETLQLIFKPGLSTAKVVTDISGRGVGMDIVRANLDRLGGMIAVETKLGQGTRFEVALPLTLAIIPALLVHVAGSKRQPARGTFAVPLASVLEAVRVPTSEIHTVNQRPVIQLRGRVLPLLRLDEVLGGADPLTQRPRWEYIVAVRWAKLDMGLVVDALIGEQDLVIKSLGPMLGEAPGVSGAAILGDGRVALIVDVPGLFKLAGA
jgi:two-component system chemotaxis sensor kinase CheA